MNYLKSLMADGNGDPSVMRYISLLVVAAVMANWVYLTVHTGAKVPLSIEELGLVTAAIGGKVAQSFAEKPAPAAPSSPAAPTTP